MDDKLKEANELVSKMNEELNLSKAEEFIKDNKISFVYDEKKYRVRLLNLAEKEELDMLRRKKFGNLLQDKDILLEKDLIKQYKERGIDIEDIDEQIKKIDAEDNVIQLQLGEAIANNDAENALKGYKEQIEELRTKKQIIRTQKNLLLDYSLENQLEGYVYQIMTYLSLEVFENNKWIKKFNSLDEFQKYPDEKLINKAASNSILLQYM